MDLRAYLSILWRRKWVIVVTVVVTMTVVVVGTLLTTRVYAATATVRVSTVPVGSASYVPLDYADRLLNTDVQLATSLPVITELEQRLNITYRPTVNAAVVANTELIRLTVEDPNPALAAMAANNLADILVVQVAVPNMVGAKTAALNQQLIQIDSEIYQAQQVYDSLVTKTPRDPEGLLAAQKTIDLKQGIYASLLQQREQARLADALQASSISVVERAITPTTPAKPRTALNLLLGLLVALGGGIGLAFLFENLDTRLNRPEQLEEIQSLSVLGLVPTVNGEGPIAFYTSNFSLEEAFRRLRTNLLARDRDAPFHTLMVASAEQGEGKSTIVANLAITFAQSRRRVIVVDGDLRRPMLHSLFKLANETGLSTVLRQAATLDEAIQNSRLPRIQVLTSGPVPSNPAELLDSPLMTSVTRELAQRCDIVLFDSAALMPVTDAAVLAPLMDSVLMVAGRGQVRKETLEAACQQLADVKAHVIGLVVNRVKADGKYDHYYEKR